ncbi:hypothetical protein [Azospirillum thermophilum]|uniref:Uncharacterized protein n=1 Tax=Azospirillum thermophilum TaxID=2202148 RepID=A0A2S2CUJ8_9PROT|nr:hypothetical protein [Azospirillum thermophilum]AWK88193.1 hypothetical protein DEW08_18945 [Azospirillum thermophilum]
MRHTLPLLATLLCGVPAMADEASILQATILDELTAAHRQAGGDRSPPTADQAAGPVAQTGRGPVASQIQAGRNRAVSIQVGTANTAAVSQSGESNLAGTAQFGTGNIASASQQGAYNLTLVEQTGGQAIWIYQRGAFNRLTPDRLPDSPAIVLQRGLDAEPRVFPLKGR